MIHTKCQDLFSLKNKKKINKKLSSAAVVYWALWVKLPTVGKHGMCFLPNRDLNTEVSFYEHSIHVVVWKKCQSISIANDLEGKNMNCAKK